MSVQDGSGGIDPADLHRKIEAGETISLLDVRDRDEFEAWHIEGRSVEAVHVPHVRFIQAEVTGSIEELAAGTDLAEPIVVVCARGEASASVADTLESAGIEAANLVGGMDAWARLYVAGEFDAGSATVRQYCRPSSGCLAYLVYADGEAVAIDPLRAFADRYAADADELGVEITGVLDTHVHADHVSGLRAVADATGAPMALPAGAADRGLAFEATLLEDGDAIDVGDASLTAVALPGHTSEMTGFRLEDVLFTGDALFLESVARPDLERGDEGAADLAATLYDTLHDRVLALPDSTRIAPGHLDPGTAPAEDGTYTARLGALRERLDLLSIGREAFVERLVEDLPPRPANYEEIIATNLGRTSVDDDEAFELELGPNNCAVSTPAD